MRFKLRTSYGTSAYMHLLSIMKIFARTFAAVLLVIAVAIFYYYGYSFGSNHHMKYNFITEDEKIEKAKLQSYAAKAFLYCKANDYNTNECLLVDMSLSSGKNRLFEYDMKNDSIITAGLVAHGSCNYNFLADAKFSNKPGCGCTALGKYKIGYKYKGRFGNAYKLYGLDSSNNNAFRRNIVLHSYYMVPDKETYPAPICNSLGCTMISENYLSILSKKIDSIRKPILLWVFE